MKDPINPSRKRVTKTTDIKKSDKKSTSGVETKTVYRKDRVTPKKIVKTEYTNYYTPKGGVMGGSTITGKQKQKFDRSGNLKSVTSLTPIKKVGGATEGMCPPGGCGHKKAQRVNSRRSAANKVGPVLKKIGKVTAGVGAAALGYAKNIGGIKDKIEGLKQQKTGGSIRKISKMQMGGAEKNNMANQQYNSGMADARKLREDAYKKADRAATSKSLLDSYKLDPSTGKMIDMGRQRKGGSVKKMQMGGDPTIARKCPKGKCGKVSVAPIGGGMQTTGSKIKSGLKKLFTQGHKAGPSRAKRIR